MHLQQTLHGFCQLNALKFRSVLVGRFPKMLVEVCGRILYRG